MKFECLFVSFFVAVGILTCRSEFLVAPLVIEEVHVMAPYVSANENSISNIEAEIKSIPWADLAGSPNCVKAIHNAKVSVDAPFKIDGQIGEPYLGVTISDLMLNEDSVERLIRGFVGLRLGGCSYGLARSLIGNKTGVACYGLFVDPALLVKGLSAPSWIVSNWNIPEGTGVCYIDDGDIRRFLFLKDDGVVGQDAMDIRDVNSDRIRSDALAAAFKAVDPKSKGSVDSKYYGNVSNWLYVNKRIRWIPPSAIPMLKKGG